MKLTHDILDQHTSALGKTAWGDLASSAAPWVVGTIRTDPLSTEAGSVLDLTCRIRPHERDIFGFRLKIEDDLSVVARESIDDRELTDPKTISAVIHRHIQTLVKKISPKLFEFDPRIGTTVGPDQVDLLPPCPLFDPTFMYVPRWFAPSPHPSKPCPLCQKRFDQGGVPMWGGGNVQWVHLGCWAKGLTLMPQTDTSGSGSGLW